MRRFKSARGIRQSTNGRFVGVGLPSNRLATLRAGHRLFQIGYHLPHHRHRIGIDAVGRLELLMKLRQGRAQVLQFVGHTANIGFRIRRDK